MGKGLLMTYGSGEDLFHEDTFWVYVESLRNVNADYVMLTHDMPEDVRKELDKKIKVVDFEREMNHIVRDRHLAFWEYLSQYGDWYDYVAVTDCRDVVFQCDPFEWIEYNIGEEHFVILVSEGFKMQRSGFACIEHFEFERDVPQHLLKEDKDRWVLNCGTILGSPLMMQNLHFLLWSVSMKSLGRVTDQATLNWLYYYLEHDSNYIVVQPQRDALCLTGEGIKEEGLQPILEGGVLHSPEKEPYCILHQWERLDVLREDIFSQYLPEDRLAKMLS
jgi:hypothetical protein